MDVCILAKLHITNTALCWSFSEHMLVYLLVVYLGWNYWVIGISICQAFSRHCQISVDHLDIILFEVAVQICCPFSTGLSSFKKILGLLYIYSG